MGLLDYFTEYFHSIDVYSLEDYTGSWGTSEKTYPTTPSKTIRGYIQPVSGSDEFKNQSLDKVTTHRMYIQMSDTISGTDKIVYNGMTYRVTYVQDNGIANISDHKEIGLVVER